MNRGFNLLELTVVVALLSALLTIARPSFNGFFERIKMKRLASELNGFMAQAKSEAVLRNQRLYAHFSFSANPVSHTNTWHITLTNQILAGGEPLLFLDGSAFRGLAIRHSYHLGYISFDSTRGRPTSGSIAFFPQQTPSMVLKVVMANPPGRVRLCGLNGTLYGYAACE